MAIPIYSARLSEKLNFGTKFLLLHFELINPHRFNFLAGQYILLSVPGTDQKKSYSICSVPETDHAIDLLIDVSPKGLGSSYLENLEIGAMIEFRGPVGQFIITNPPEEDHYVLVASGSGISPLRSILLDELITKKTSKQVTLFWGLRYPEDIFWQEDLYQLDQEYTNFNFEIILSKPPVIGWDLSTGYVTDLVSQRILDTKNKGFYLCGNKAMIEDCRQLLTNMNVDPNRIHFEKLY